MLVVIVPRAVVPIYGPAFTAASSLSLMLVPAYLLRGSNQMLVAILRGSGVPMGASAGQVESLITLSALLPLGVSAGGVGGAAVAVTVSAAVGFVWLLTTAWRYGRLSLGDVIRLWRLDITHLFDRLRSISLMTRR